jgi:hypothetical protein
MRLTFGPRAGLIDELRTVGGEEWFLAAFNGWAKWF